MSDIYIKPLTPGVIPHAVTPLNGVAISGDNVRYLGIPGPPSAGEVDLDAHEQATNPHPNALSGEDLAGIYLNGLI